MKDEKFGFPLGDFSWYVTLMIERPLQVEQKYVTEEAYSWIDTKIMLNLSDGFHEATKLHLDRIASHVASVIGKEFFSKVVIESIFFDASNKTPSGIPQFKLGNITVSRSFSIEALPHSLLCQQLTNLRDTPEGMHRALDTARHWYLTSLQEQDPWKKFIWAFQALEILTNKLSKRYYNDTIDNLRLSIDTDRPVTKAIRELILPHERLTLVSKFAIVALQIFPEDSENDVRMFRTLQKARNELTHGQIRDESKLPVHNTVELLDKYFSASLMANKHF